MECHEGFERCSHENLIKLSQTINGSVNIPYQPHWVYVDTWLKYSFPIGSMYGICTYIWLILLVYVGINIYHTWILWVWDVADSKSIFAESSGQNLLYSLTPRCCEKSRPHLQVCHSSTSDTREDISNLSNCITHRIHGTGILTYILP